MTCREQAEGIVRISLADPAQDIIYGQPMIECDKNGLLSRIESALREREKATIEACASIVDNGQKLWRQRPKRGMHFEETFEGFLAEQIRALRAESEKGTK